MKLVPFSAKYLRLDEPLPFGLRDAGGRLLLGSGQRVEGQHRINELKAQPLFAYEAESADWNRRLAATVDSLMRQGAQLQELADARPEVVGRDLRAAAEASVGEQWDALVMQLDAALRDASPTSQDWLARLESVRERARQLLNRRSDAALYHLVYEAGQHTAKYSSHHAMLSMVIGELAAPVLGWSAAWTDSLGRAALTMNLGMLRLQDQLAQTMQKLSVQARAEIDRHAELSAAMLSKGGMDDALCIDVVRLHHDTSHAERPLAELEPAYQLARLLRRVDIFSAKISKRAAREPMSPVQAAREACLDNTGKPDEIGGALLKAVGLYPPGSFVELVNGEIGIVIARGRRANLPVMASLVASSGNPLGQPALRDTIEQRYAVKAAVAPALIKVRPPHDRLMALR